MIHIRAIFEHEIITIKKMAYDIWSAWYLDTIMGEKQMTYMLNMMYNEDKIKSDIDSGAIYLVIIDGNKISGFAAYQHGLGDQNDMTKLHKLYVIPDVHKKGLGGSLFDYVEMRARENQSNGLFLHVNRQNISVDFYKHKGMHIAKSEDNDIGEGYFMYDYVMEKRF
ncbi:MAG TPA: GNAT family N-acetyltransferase [Saprospiraceae bacterium]|mgnify:CR=1 FL=1|nr:GNAT family N-acetyltransferase [Saprospiraceae bacterium]